MLLDPKLAEMYKALAEYAGMGVTEEGALVTLTSDPKPVKNKKDKPYFLPYDDVLNRPNGRVAFHILNENFVRPMGAAFCDYKYNLLAELNLKLAMTLDIVMNIATLPSTEQRLKSGNMLELFADIGEVELKVEKGKATQPLIQKLFIGAVKSEGSLCFLDVFLKRNGTVNGETFTATGEVNFILFKRIMAAIENKETKLYGVTIRKKDLLVLERIMRVLFEDIENKDKYTSGVDNGLFSYLDALLSACYIVTNRLNHVLTGIIEDRGDDSGEISEFLSDHTWTRLLPEVLGMKTEIQLIPNQDNIADEVADSNDGKLNIDRSKATSIRDVQQQAPRPQTTTPPVQQPVQQPVQPSYQPQAYQPPVQQYQPVQQGYQPQGNYVPPAPTAVTSNDDLINMLNNGISPLDGMPVYEQQPPQGYHPQQYPPQQYHVPQQHYQPQGHYQQQQYQGYPPQYQPVQHGYQPQGNAYIQPGHYPNGYDGNNMGQPNTYVDQYGNLITNY